MLARWIIASLLWLALTTLAFAHAALTGTQPAAGTLLPAPPERIALSFSEPVSPLVMTLVRPDGSTASLAVSGAGTPSLTVTPPDGLARGTYLLSWRVVSADGHPVGGALDFSVGEKTPLPTDPADAEDVQVAIGVWASKLLLYVGVFFGIGGAAACLWFPGFDAPGKRIGLMTTALGLAGCALAAGFQGLDTLGAPLSGIGNPAVWAAAFETSFARTLPILALAFVLAFLAIMLRNGWLKPVFALLALAGAAGALAASGHAAAASPQWLTRPAVFLHALTLALWLGALPPLGLALIRSQDSARVALERFSKGIPAAVAVLILSGTILAVIQVEWPAALLATDYGRILVAKLALVLLLLALAAYNRLRLTTPALAREPTATRRLAKLIALETLVVVIILGLAAGWRFTPPPRALAIAASEPATVHIHTAEVMAEVTITPGHAGPVKISAIVMTGDFGPLDADDVTFILTPPDAASPLRVKAHKPGDGTWAADEVNLRPAGNWRLTLELSAGGKTAILSDQFSLGALSFKD